jgi:hypothetical protein
LRALFHRQLVHAQHCNGAFLTGQVLYCNLKYVLKRCSCCLGSNHEKNALTMSLPQIRVGAD